MLLTLFWVILCTSIVVFFSEEVADFLKKITAIPGVKLFVPLLFASWVVETYEDWLLWLLLLTKGVLRQFLVYTAAWMPFQTGSVQIVQVLFLFLVRSFPLWITFAVKKYKKIPEPWPQAYLVGAFMWATVAILLVEQPLG